MNIGKATAIFQHIRNEKYSEDEKLVAIKKTLDMPTHNGITKDEILDAFRWMWEYCTKEEEKPLERVKEAVKGNSAWASWMHERFTKTM